MFPLSVSFCLPFSLSQSVFLCTHGLIFTIFFSFSAGIFMMQTQTFFYQLVGKLLMLSVLVLAFYLCLAQWLERRTSDRKVAAGATRELSSPGLTFCADCYFGIRSTPVLPL